jgi:hypothetical protein
MPFGLTNPSKTKKQPLAGLFALLSWFLRIIPIPAAQFFCIGNEPEVLKVDCC